MSLFQQIAWLAGGLLVTVCALAEVPVMDVVAAVPRDFPPYYQVDSRGQPQGQSIEIMGRLAESARLRIRYEVTPDWDSAMEALRQGKAELIPNLGITPERLREFDFTNPLETLALGLFVRGENARITGGDDLAGVKVAVVKSNAAVAWVHARPQVEPVEFQTPEQALFALLAGEVDAFIYPNTVTWKMAAAIGVEERIREVGPPLMEIKRAVAVRKGNNSLLQRIDAAVRDYTRSEEFGETYARFHGRNKPAWSGRMASYVAAGGTLLLALAALLWWHYHHIVVLRRRLDECAVSLEHSRSELSELKARLRGSAPSDQPAA